MFLGLKDFNIDIFLKMDDKNIFIYYADLDSIPQIQTLVPLGSFDDDGKLPYVSLSMEDRLKVGIEFLHRDFYAEYEKLTNKSLIRIDRFLEQFGNIPEVVDFFDKYIAMCEVDNPPYWCTKCRDLNQQPPGVNCPDCEECPDYNNPEFEYTAIKVPADIFTEEDLYYVMILYFNGIYRVNPEHAQNFGVYEILTDVNFDMNYYTLIIDIKEFFTTEFINFLRTLPGSIPFANDYGCEIKLAVQTKNFVVQRLEVEAEINFFIENFNSIYGDLVHVEDVNILSQESDIGADTWLVEVFAIIKQERLIYRLEV